MDLATFTVKMRLKKTYYSVCLFFKSLLIYSMLYHLKPNDCCTLLKMLLHSMLREDGHIPFPGDRICWIQSGLIILLQIKSQASLEKVAPYLYKYTGNLYITDPMCHYIKYSQSLPEGWDHGTCAVNTETVNIPALYSVFPNICYDRQWTPCSR